MSYDPVQPNTPIIPLAEIRRFVIDCMMAVGAPKNNAEKLAENIVEADYRGFYGHGLNRLEIYLKEVRRGVCNAAAVPKELNESYATSWVDGNNGLGPVVGAFCMDLAIQKAQKLGVGLVVCKGSNHFGIATVYTMQALKKGLIGLCFSNTPPMVAPPRTKNILIGTNPWSMAAPGMRGDNFILDMATSVVSRGRIEMLKMNHMTIPSQWADPVTGALCPLGGTEDNSSYKGYGLAMIAEVLCGILSGGAYGPNIRMLGHFDKVADLGHCFIAIDPKCFAPGFDQRLSSFLQSLRQAPRIDRDRPVWVAGDRERLHMKAVDEARGLRYVQELLDACRRLAQELKVKPLQPLANR